MSRAACWTSVGLAAILSQGFARAQTTSLVSVDSTGAQGNLESDACSISADGRFVAFSSFATNLVGGDTNGWNDIFVHDRQSGATERLSVDSAGGQGNGLSEHPAISADGRYVAFDSGASNLVAGDTNAASDIFLHDRQLGTTERVSVDSAGGQGNGGSVYPVISADGRFVAFESAASNLVATDTNATFDIFVRDRRLGTTERVSLSSGGGQGNSGSGLASISVDGRCVAFRSSSTNLVAGDTNGNDDIFVRDRLLGTTERVSVDTGGSQANGTSAELSISGDGRCVAFLSQASNLVAGDTNGTPDVFVHDRQTGTTERVSVATGGVQTNGASFMPFHFPPALSPDGRFVAFDSSAWNLVAGDTNGTPDIFVHDRRSGTTERVSVDSGGAQGNGTSARPAITPDGRFVAFFSNASNLVAGDTNSTWDVFVRDQGDPPPPVPFCSGDGSSGACPCGNSGATGHGCENSASTGGALQSATGTSLLSNDTLVLTSSGERPTALSIFLQGTAVVAPANFGDGLRCTSGQLKRLYTHNASAGVVSAPQPGDPSISARSAALGDVIGVGTTRYYQTYYRDPVLGFCPNPPGNSWNVSSGLAISWAQ
jgi:Tol biopolymer transport system component